MAPYRSVEQTERAEAPRDPGIVGDVIAQFADPLAFYRELVQNAIDAGTDTIEVRLEHDGAAGVLRVAVRDRGEGMTRDIVENQLLVLFRSTKERDDSKIGKFGIGFASVLAPKPAVIIVHTSRDGRRLTLHLNPDLTYELFDAGPSTKSGTTVQLELAMDAERAAGFAHASEVALVRWCRHATVPIELRVEIALANTSIAVRIDRPLGLENVLVEVRGTVDDGALTAVVGLPATRAPYAGFFNHGLMLYETTERLLGPLAVKIQDSRLGHTLSRDNVRRDGRFDRALAYARDLAGDDLPRAIVRELRAAAEAADRSRYVALARAIAAAELTLSGEEWCFPLVEPIAGGRTITGAQLPMRALGAERRSELTAALARANVPVLDLGPHGLHELVLTRAADYGCRISEIEAELTSVAIVEPSGHDLAMLAELSAALGAAHRKPSKVLLGHLAGACATHLAVAGGPDDAIHSASDPAAYVIDLDRARANPFALLRRPALVLSVGHPLVAAARRGDPRVAASHLARVILLHHRLLDADRSADLLAHTLDRLGVAQRGPVT